MINPFTQINWHPDKAALCSFGKVVFIGMVIIAILVFCIALCKGLPYEEAGLPAFIITGIGFFVWLLSFVWQQGAKVVYLLWFIFGASVGIVISNIALIAFFYLLFTPYAVLIRWLTKRDVLCLKLKAGVKSNWCKLKDCSDLRMYFKQY